MGSPAVGGCQWASSRTQMFCFFVFFLYCTAPCYIRFITSCCCSFFLLFIAQYWFAQKSTSVVDSLPFGSMLTAEGWAISWPSLSFSSGLCEMEHTNNNSNNEKKLTISFNFCVASEQLEHIVPPCVQHGDWDEFISSKMSTTFPVHYEFRSCCFFFVFCVVCLFVVYYLSQ